MNRLVKLLGVHKCDDCGHALIRGLYVHVHDTDDGELVLHARCAEGLGFTFERCTTCLTCLTEDDGDTLCMDCENE